VKILSGTDLVYMPRISRIIEEGGEGFTGRVLSESEIELFDKAAGLKRKTEILAGRFAAKEAAAKALGTGLLADGVGFSDFEILPDDSGRPILTLKGRAKEKADSMGVVSVSVSITHDNDYAGAVCTILTDEED